MGLPRSGVQGQDCEVPGLIGGTVSLSETLCHDVRVHTSSQG